MHMFFRTFLIFFRKRFLKKIEIDDMGIISMRVLPTDLDLLWHVNNGVYLSLMDFGRWDHIFRSGVFDLAKKNGWYSVVAGEAIKFRKSLKLWDKFELHTKIIGNDEKFFFIEQKFFLKSQLMATGIVKVRFLKMKGGGVNTKEVLALYGKERIGQAEDLSKDWFNLDSKYLA